MDDLTNVLFNKVSVLQYKILDSGLAKDPGRLSIQVSMAKNVVNLWVIVDGISLVNVNFARDAFITQFTYSIEESNDLPRETAIASYIISDFARNEDFAEVAPDES